MHYSLLFFFFNDTATTEIYTLSLHDALPICFACDPAAGSQPWQGAVAALEQVAGETDRKSTRLNSSHVETSYADFSLKKTKVALRRHDLCRKQIKKVNKFSLRSRR